MVTPDSWSGRLPAWVRLFVFVLAAAPAIFQETRTVVGLLLVGLVWGAAALVERHGVVIVVLVEAAVSAVVAGLGLEYSQAILVILVAPPFIAALHGGVRLMVPTFVTEGVVVAVTVLSSIPTLSTEQVFALITWGLGALGLGLIGSFLATTAAVPDSDELAPYRDAQRLLRQLLHLSDNLSSGLDASSLGGVVGSAVRDRLPTSWLAVYVPRGEDLVPLLTKGENFRGDAGSIEQLAMESWARGVSLHDGDDFAFPLGQKVVIGGAIEPSAGMSRADVQRRIDLLLHALRLPSVQLDTALMFADFRASATADVRRRLAREMHDGVAQDIASLGYIVDALAARPASPQQEKQFAMLRERITAVVTEVRQSVLTLRTSIGEADSLGEAIGNVARHLSDASQVPIQVTLDERSARLRYDVESELFRIAQEAMNNAVKHAQATQVSVHCQVHAPDARITITDDGRGLQPSRSDSHGLKIMRERARLAGAELQLSSSASGGLVVSVVLDATGGLGANPRDHSSTDRTGEHAGPAVPRPSEPTKVNT